MYDIQRELIAGNFLYFFNNCVYFYAFINDSVLDILRQIKSLSVRVWVGSWQLQ
jgi:hypothetical protein